MRALTSAVLVIEAIVLGLAIPVAVLADGQPAWYAWALGALALAALLLPALATRPGYLAAGWVLQAAVLVLAVVGRFTAETPGAIPMLPILALIFLALWWTTLHLARKVERQQSEAGLRG